MLNIVMVEQQNGPNVDGRNFNNEEVVTLKPHPGMIFKTKYINIVFFYERQNAWQIFLCERIQLFNNQN